MSLDLKISGFPLWRLADSHAGFAGYVWTEAESAKKKLRIKKYPDSCGPGPKTDE